MGTSRSAAELARKFDTAAARLKPDVRRGVIDGARLTQTIIRSTAASRGVAPAARIAGRPWSVTYSVKGDDKPAAVVSVRGNFHLVESDTRGHFIVARGYGGTRASRQGRVDSAFRTRGAGGRARGFLGTNLSLADATVRARALRIRGRFAAYARHPGTRGKHIFRDSVKQAERAVPPVVQKRINGSLTAAFR